MVSFKPTPAFDTVEILPEDPVRWLSAEQSNSSVVVDHKVMLKLFRKLAPGRHPEAEMTRALTERGFANAPAQLGEIVHVQEQGEEEVLGIVQAYIPGEGDAWDWTASYLGRVLDELSREGADLADLLSTFESFAGILGQRLGEMHVALSRPTDDDAFAPASAGREQVERWTERIEGRILKACDHLARLRDGLGEEERALADRVLSKRKALLALVKRLCRAGKGSLLHRIHGDFHLGQTLVASGDVMIIDFEGEPSQPLAERRAKDSGWRDVAGILRSFDYALAAAQRSPAAVSHDGAYATLAAAFRERMPQALLQAYSQATAERNGRRSGDGAADRALLDLFMVEKAAYEIGYEASNRPDWLAVPLRGLAELMDRLLSGGVADD